MIFDGRKMVEVRDWGVSPENSLMLLEDGLVRVISNVSPGEEKTQGNYDRSGNLPSSVWIAYKNDQKYWADVINI